MLLLRIFREEHIRENEEGSLLLFEFTDIAL